MANGSFKVCRLCSIRHGTQARKATIATARQMGVKVKMVTGDALAIALETAKGYNILMRSGWGDAQRQESEAVADFFIENADGSHRYPRT